MKKKTGLIFLFYFIFTFININAQNFIATTDFTKVGENDKFTVTFTLNGADDSRISNFKAPQFNGFKVLSGPMQSSSIQIINGKMSASFSFSYVLIPTSVGKFKIGAAQITQAGKTFTSNELTIEVVKGNTPKSNNNTNANDDISKNLFILAIPDKNTVYKGEQITVTYKLYTRINISSPQISKLPQFNGFWTEELNLPGNIVLSDDVYKGERFKSAIIKKAALFPTQDGKLTISPFELKMNVVVRKKRSTNDIFDDFFDDPFFGRTETKEVLVKSNTININVLPLPKTDIPYGFSESVGNFTFNASLDKKEVTQNEPFTLKFEISGTGNIKLANIPVINLPSGFDKYEPKITEKINRNGKIYGTKTIEYLIVPRISGTHKINPVEFSFFDPDKKKYVTLTSPSFQITVLRGKNLSNNANYDKEDITLLNEDISYIKTGNFNLVPINNYTLLTKWFWIFIITPIIALFVAIKLIKRKEHLNSNIALLKFKKAEKFARKKLKFAKEFLDQKDLNQFYEKVYSAFFGFLQDKLNIPQSELNIETINQILLQKEISNEIIDKVKNTAEQCEFARFAPTSLSFENATKFYETTVLLIVELEELLSDKKRK